MLSPPSSRIITLLVTVSFLLGSRAPAQETAKQKPDYSQEAVVIERVTNTYRFERDGTGRHEARVRVRDERLRPLAVQLKTIKYQLVFPDNSPTKIIRRGALLCLPKPGACTFTMTSPELVRSVE